MCPEIFNLWAIEERMWYVRDGVPAAAHFSGAVWDVHNNIYRDRWIGKGGHSAWPPRSPDLNPLDFYLWGNVKCLVYAAPVDNEEALHHRFTDDFQTIRNTPASGRVEPCIGFQGGHFEHLL
jgi:hypothetical protein